MKKAIARTFLLALTIGGIALTSYALAGKKPPGGGGGGTACPDVWDPVTCANGVTYSNQCYANVAKAPGPCVPAGGGPTQVE